MNKIEKFLLKLRSDERIATKEQIRRIILGDISNLDVKKLKGRVDIYRVRVGRIRILCQKDKFGQYEVVDIGNRDDNTYN